MWRETNFHINGYLFFHSSRKAGSFHIKKRSQKHINHFLAIINFKQFLAPLSIFDNYLLQRGSKLQTYLHCSSGLLPSKILSFIMGRSLKKAAKPKKVQLDLPAILAEESDEDGDSRSAAAPSPASAAPTAPPLAKKPVGMAMWARSRNLKGNILGLKGNNKKVLPVFKKTVLKILPFQSQMILQRKGVMMMMLT